MPAILPRLAIAATPAVPALLDHAGRPIPGTDRPALPGIPARAGRPAMAAEGMVTCSFDSNGHATTPNREEELMSLFDLD